MQSMDVTLPAQFGHVASVCDNCKPGKCTWPQVCEECNNGYYIANSTCTPCDGKCVTCTGPGSCVRCRDRFYLYHRRCHRCPHTCKTCRWYTRTSCDSCELGYYGDGCMFKCSHNCRGQECYKVGGTCRFGCLHGYFGPTCMFSCSGGCLNKKCETSGDCSDGCREGYYGDKCTQCPITCATCESQTSCTSCRRGFFGSKCRHRCAHCQDGHCNVYGTCVSGCTDGYYRASGRCHNCPGHCSTCNSSSECIVCTSGHFGRKCKSTCPQNCSSCHKLTGQCVDNCIKGSYSNTPGLCDESRQHPTSRNCSGLSSNKDCTGSHNYTDRSNTDADSGVKSKCRHQNGNCVPNDGDGDADDTSEVNTSEFEAESNKSILNKLVVIGTCLLIGACVIITGICVVKQFNKRRTTGKKSIVPDTQAQLGALSQQVPPQENVYLTPLIHSPSVSVNSEIEIYGATLPETQNMYLSPASSAGDHGTKRRARKKSCKMDNINHRRTQAREIYQTTTESGDLPDISTSIFVVGEGACVWLNEEADEEEDVKDNGEVIYQNIPPPRQMFTTTTVSPSNSPEHVGPSVSVYEPLELRPKLNGPRSVYSTLEETLGTRGITDS